MEDRWNRLSVEAHLRGQLSFERSHRYDPHWLLKEHVVLGALEREMAVEMNKLVLQWHCHAAQISDWDEGKLFEYHKAKAEESFNDVGKHYLPWYAQWGENEATRLIDLWKRFKAEEKAPGFSDWRDRKKEDMNALVRAAEEEATALDAAYEKRGQREHEQSARQARRRARARLR